MSQAHAAAGSLEGHVILNWVATEQVCVSVCICVRVYINKIHTQALIRKKTYRSKSGDLLSTTLKSKRFSPMLLESLHASSKTFK